MCTLECLFSKDEESRSRSFPLRQAKGNLYFSIFVCDTHCGKPSTMGPKFPDSTPFLRTQSSDRGLSAKNHFQSYRTKIDFCHSVRLCVLYIRAAAAARDRVAAVVGAWPNIWLRHHQTRYFFFSISLSLSLKTRGREACLMGRSPPQTFDTMMADIEIQTTKSKFDCFLFSTVLKNHSKSLTQFCYTQNVAF